MAALAVTSVMGATLVASGPPVEPTAAPAVDDSELRGRDEGHDPGLTSSRSASRAPLPPPRPSRPRFAVAAAPGVVNEPREVVEPPATEVTPAQVTDHAFMTAALNVWSGPGEAYSLIDVLPSGTKVAVTGEVADGQWAEISYEGRSRWVNAAYLSDEEPQPEPEEPQPEPEEPQPQPEEPQPQPEEQSTAGSGLSSSPCASGSEVESGLQTNAVAVHRAVCAAFPEVSAYGGLRVGDDGEHGQGLALDIMVSSATGDQVAEFVRANSGALGVSEVLWAQQIWTVERSSEGWRAMEDRGSATANHYDHVHVTVYG